MVVKVKVVDLYDRAKEMLNDGMDYAVVSFMEADEDLPAALHFEGHAKSRPFEGVDYEELDDISSTL